MFGFTPTCNLRRKASLRTQADPGALHETQSFDDLGGALFESIRGASEYDAALDREFGIARTGQVRAEQPDRKVLSRNLGPQGRDRHEGVAGAIANVKLFLAAIGGTMPTVVIVTVTAKVPATWGIPLMSPSRPFAPSS